MKTCPKCKGKGLETGPYCACLRPKCSRCGGRGVVREDDDR